MSKKKKEPTVIMVDCFNTIILRNKSNKQIFQNWAREVATVFGVDEVKFLKTYNHINWALCTKKLFSRFVLQAKFEDVLDRVYQKLSKTNLIDDNFIQVAKQKYIDCEKETHFVVPQFISFLRAEKEKGKKIVVVSDFYCGSEMLSIWLDSLGILDIFDGVYSSADVNKEKSTTKLYRYLLNKLNVTPEEVIMYGDNCWSDVFMPRVVGMKSRRINHKKRNYEKD
ncbi:MAG: HAD family hydrolase [Clostridia bacterium]|nr:HAD family hydrolase [Clostridia bacterium]